MAKIRSSLKPSSFLHRHRFALFFFVFLAVYHVALVNQFKPWTLQDITYSFHCVDFSCGFATKLLPGAVFNAILGKHASLATATVYETVLLMLIFAGVSVFLERFLRCVGTEQRLPAFYLLLFFVTGSYTFSIFSEELGMLDVYWVLLSLLFLCFLEHKVLRFLTPVLFVAALLVHFSALLSCIVLFAILLLYRGAVAKERREKKIYLALFAVSVVVTAASFLFFVFFETRTLSSMEEIRDTIKAHGSEYYYYYDYAFFDNYFGEPIVPASVTSMAGSLQKILLTLLHRVRFRIDLAKDIGFVVPLSFFGGLVILSPILFVVYRFHLQCFRSETDKLRRFCTLLMMLQFPTMVLASMLFSVDTTRWLSHEFLAFYTCLFAVLFYEEKRRIAFLNQLAQYIRDYPVNLYFLGYATIHFCAYF